jgi:hypothetical protein
MRNVNADIDKMKEFMADLKRHKEEVSAKQQMILHKLNNLSHYWKDKVYEKYKEEFVKENNVHTKKLIEFYDLQLNDLRLKISELEEYIDKFHRR